MQHDQLGEARRRRDQKKNEVKMNEEIRIGEKKTKGLLIPSLAGMAVAIGCIAPWHWSDVGGCFDRINSRMAQLDQAARRLDALERAMNALPGALPSVEAVAPLLVVPPPDKIRPAPPAPPKIIPLKPLTAAPAAVAASWQQQMLNEHNKWRRVVDVPPLVWSAELERSAQRVVDQLAADGCKFEHSGSKYGENLHKSGAVKWTSGRTEHRPKTPAQIVGKWGSEVDSYRWIDNTCTGVCGHYTQMVWKNTKAVGCARARCGSKEDIAGCLYDPAGNVRGQRPF